MIGFRREFKLAEAKEPTMTYWGLEETIREIIIGLENKNRAARIMLTSFMDFTILLFLFSSMSLESEGPVIFV